MDVIHCNFRLKPDWKIPPNTMSCNHRNNKFVSIWRLKKIVARKPKITIFCWFHQKPPLCPVQLQKPKPLGMKVGVKSNYNSPWSAFCESGEMFKCAHAWLKSLSICTSIIWKFLRYAYYLAQWSLSDILVQSLPKMDWYRFISKYFH